jgi:hypothetical protein
MRWAGGRRDAASPVTAARLRPASPTVNHAEVRQGPRHPNGRRGRPPARTPRRPRAHERRRRPSLRLSARRSSRRRAPWGGVHTPPRSSRKASSGGVRFGDVAADWLEHGDGVERHPVRSTGDDDIYSPRGERLRSSVAPRTTRTRRSSSALAASPCCAAASPWRCAGATSTSPVSPPACAAAGSTGRLTAHLSAEDRALSGTVPLTRSAWGIKALPRADRRAERSATGPDRHQRESRLDLIEAASVGSQTERCR